jgi:transposase
VGDQKFFDIPCGEILFPCMKTKKPKSNTPFKLTKREKQNLNKVLHFTSDIKVYRRAEAILAMGAGDSPGAIAKRLHVSRQILYSWFYRFKDGQEDDIEKQLADKDKPGRPKKAKGIVDPWILEVIDTDPRTFGYHSTTWTADLLARYIYDHHGISISYCSARRALDRLGFRWKRARYILSRRSPNWRRQKGGLNTAFSAIPGGSS